MKCLPALVFLTAVCAVSAVRGVRAEQPVQSDVFVDSAGIDIHLNYNTTPYFTNFPLVESSLKELGIRHVRDVLAVGMPQTYYNRHNQLGLDGIHGLFTATGSESLAQLQQWPSNLPASFEGYEAPNEADNNNDPYWVPTLQAFLPTLYSAAKTGAAPNSIVVGPSLVHIPSYALLGDVSHYEDFGNLHNYHDGRNPGTTGWASSVSKNYGSTPWNMSVEALNSGTKPIIGTETGYTNDMTQQGAVIEAISALYLPRVFLMGWLYGNPRTYVYELLSSVGKDFGLLRADGSRKPSFGAVANMLNLLADPGPSFTPTPATYTISGGGAGLQHLLMQKRDGTYYLAVWLETQLYNVDTFAYTPAAPQAVTIHFDHPVESATAYQLDSGGGMTAAVLDVSGDLNVSASSAVQFLKVQLNSSLSRLTVQVPNPVAGNVTVTPVAANGVYNSGDAVTISAQSNPGFVFSGFTGDEASPASSFTVRMSSDQHLVANFGCVSPTLTTSTSSLSYGQQGGASTISVTTGTGCPWKATTASNWLTITPVTQQYGSGSVQVSVPVNPNPARTGQILIGASAVSVHQSTQLLLPVSLVTTTYYGVISQTGALTSRVLTHSAAGLVSVDGTLVPTPATVNWYAGSTHTLAIVQPQFVMGQPYTSFGWSQAPSASSISVTAGTAATSFTQNLISSALLTTNVVGGGTLSITPGPSPTGGYYVLGQKVSIAATPNQGCAFGGFSNAVSSPAPAVVVYMTKAQTVTATFNCGAALQKK